MNASSPFPTTLGDEFVEPVRREPRAEVRSSRSFRLLKDSDPMPFGPYKDRRMDEVPASYLDHLRDANWLPSWPAVEEYVERNAKAIDLELKETERRRGY